MARIRAGRWAASGSCTVYVCRTCCWVGGSTVAETISAPSTAMASVRSASRWGRTNDSATRVTRHSAPSPQRTPTSSRPAAFMRATAAHPARCTVTTPPRTANPVTSSGGTGVQQRASRTAAPGRSASTWAWEAAGRSGTGRDAGAAAGPSAADREGTAGVPVVSSWAGWAVSHRWMAIRAAGVWAWSSHSREGSEAGSCPTRTCPVSPPFGPGPGGGGVGVVEPLPGGFGGGVLAHEELHRVAVLQHGAERGQAPVDPGADAGVRVLAVLRVRGVHAAGALGQAERAAVGPEDGDLAVLGEVLAQGGPEGFGVGRGPLPVQQAGQPAGAGGVRAFAVRRGQFLGGRRVGVAEGDD